MKKRFNQSLLALMGFILCSCSPAYRSAEGNGIGYGDQQVTNRIFKVSYQGGLSLDKSQVESMALYRAAELMKDRGFERFCVLRSSAISRPLFAETPIVVASPQRMGGMHAEMIPHIRDRQNSYFAELTIQALEPTDADVGPEIYNCSEVMRFLGQKIGVDQAKSHKGSEPKRN